MNKEEKEAIENLRILAEYMGENYFFSKQGIRALKKELIIALNYIDTVQHEIKAKDMVHDYDVKMIDEAKGQAVEWKKELNELKKELEKANKQLDLDYVDNNFISIDEIKQLVGYEENEDVSKDEIISLLKTIWEEFNRLEDIEDYMETQCISKKKIREKIKELDLRIRKKAPAGWELEMAYAKYTLKELLGEKFN